MIIEIFVGDNLGGGSPPLLPSAVRERVNRNQSIRFMRILLHLRWMLLLLRIKSIPPAEIPALLDNISDIMKVGANFGFSVVCMRRLFGWWCRRR